MSTLTNSQQSSLTNLVSWYHGGNPYAVLHGKAGSGKSYLIDTFLEKLGNRVKPLIIADTNEAVAVIKRATKEKYTYGTVCSTLGLTLGFEKDEQVLVKRTDPDLSNYNLIVVDEASTLDSSKLSYLKDTGMYILFVGHKSQLPPVITDLRIDDPCISPVFVQGYPTWNLIEPVRNTTGISDFCNDVEKLIYARGVVPNKYKVDPKFVTDYLLQNKESIWKNETMALAYTNKRVDELNQILRTAVFGTVTEDYVVGDKLIFRSPIALFDMPVRKDMVNLNVLFSKHKHVDLTTNTRATVLRVNYKEILGIACYELQVETSNLEIGYVYAVSDEISYLDLRKKMYCSALYDHNEASATRKWKLYHDLNLLLGRVKHSYALTVHCSQGSTIENVLVDDNDINKCQHPVLKKKLRYVAFSRAKSNLYRI
jgi:GTPase SAR1 family protein